MKRLLIQQDVFGMANLNPQKAGLGSIVIWADHGGVSRPVSHRNTPRVKMDKGDMSISVSISDNPKILAQSRRVNKRNVSEFQPGIDYVRRNYEIFLKHYMDTDFSFDDEDLFQALRDKGEYR